VKKQSSNKASGVSGKGMTSGKTPAAKQPAPTATVSQASKKAPPAGKKR
jgi:hypothetical protein